MTIKIALDEIRTNLKIITDKLDIPLVNFLVEPSEPGFGDLTSNIAFLMAKHLKTKPSIIAQDIAKQYMSLNHTLIDGVTAMPSGHINFDLKWSSFAKLVLADSDLVDIDLGKRMPIIVEHTSVNPNKALHIGHLRNMIIGDVVSKILTKVNYDVRVLNYIDDLGLQIADVVVGFRHLGFAYESPEKRFDHYCGDDVYVQTHKRYDLDPTLKRLRDDTLVQLEDLSSDVGRFAQDLTRRVLACQLETCWKIGVFYDCLNFESHIIRSGLWSELFDKLKTMNLIEFETQGDNKGCWVIRGRDDEKDKVLIRSSGTATYIAKDISYAAWKMGLVEDPFRYVQYDVHQPDTKTLWKSVLKDGKQINFSGNKVLTVIDSRQARLQNIISEILTNFESDITYVHLRYGSVTLSSDTAKAMGADVSGNQTQMSGRSGLYVSIDAVYDMLRERATAETRARNPSMSDDKVDLISHNIAVGTLRYEMIKQDLERNIIFDLTKSLSLTGDTATYLMYTFARASRILEKVDHKVSDKFDHSNIDCNVFATPTEFALIKDISMYPMHVHDAVKNLSPKVIARYCHDLAVSFNAFYEETRVLGIEPSIESARLWLVDSFCKVIKDALDLLGITVPDKM